MFRTMAVFIIAILAWFAAPLLGMYGAPVAAILVGVFALGASVYAVFCLVRYV